MARNLDRQTLLNPRPKDPNSDDKDKVFLITTYHPDDQCVPNITRHNWSLLGRNQATETLFHKKLTCGYRRPKNLRDILCKAKTGRQTGDETVDPGYVAPPPPAVLVPTLQTVPRKAVKQTSMLDFLKYQDTNRLPEHNIPTR